jgi:hypothetical protein
MKTDTKMTAICKYCGTYLSLSHTGPCPKCGKEGKNIVAEINDTVHLRDSQNLETRREFFEKNPKIKWIIITITLFSSLLGLILSVVTGIVIGLLLGILSYWLGPLAVTKVRETKQVILK